MSGQAPSHHMGRSSPFPLCGGVFFLKSLEVSCRSTLSFPSLDCVRAPYLAQSVHIGPRNRQGKQAFGPRVTPIGHLRVGVERAFRASSARLASMRTNTPPRARQGKLRKDSTGAGVRSEDEYPDQLQTGRLQQARIRQRNRHQGPVKESVLFGPASLGEHGCSVVPIMLPRASMGSAVEHSRADRRISRQGGCGRSRAPGGMLRFGRLRERPVGPVRVRSMVSIRDP